MTGVGGGGSTLAGGTQEGFSGSTWGAVSRVELEELAPDLGMGLDGQTPK